VIRTLGLDNSARWRSSLGVLPAQIAMTILGVKIKSAGRMMVLASLRTLAFFSLILSYSCLHVLGIACSFLRIPLSYGAHEETSTIDCVLIAD